MVRELSAHQATFLCTKLLVVKVLYLYLTGHGAQSQVHSVSRVLMGLEPPSTVPYELSRTTVNTTFWTSIQVSNEIIAGDTW